MLKVLAVADASVLINLISSGSFASVVTAADMRLRATEKVIGELQAGGTGSDAGRLVRSALARIEVARLSGKAIGRRRQLSHSRLMRSLGDGEATTIAYAHASGLPALMDERKGMKVCQQAGIDCFTSVDVFRRALKGGLSQAAVAEAVYRALQDANMGVRPEDQRWVVDLIGRQRAKSCRSLPERIRSGQ